MLLGQEMLVTQRAMVAAQLGRAREDINAQRAEFLASCGGRRRRAEAAGVRGAGTGRVTPSAGSVAVGAAGGAVLGVVGGAVRGATSGDVGPGTQLSGADSAGSPARATPLSGPGAVAAAAAAAAASGAPQLAAISSLPPPSISSHPSASPIPHIPSGTSLPPGTITVSANIKFHVGQVVRHKRYNYRGVVYGWDPVCSSSEEWMLSMGVDGLPGGRAQPFYKVLVDERDRPFLNTYVAQVR